MSIKETLSDLINNTTRIGFERIRVKGSDTDTLFLAMTSDTSLLMRAKASKTIPEFKGVFGLGALGVLRGYLNIFNAYDDAVISVLNAERNGETVLTDISFSAKGKSSAKYRLIGEAALSKIMVPKDIKWDITTTISLAKINEFSSFGDIMSSIEENFIVSVKDGNLLFSLGEPDAADNRVEVVIGEVANNLSGSFKFPIKTFQTLLKQGNSPTIRFNNLGLALVEYDTGLISYEFTIKGQAR